MIPLAVRSHYSLMRGTASPGALCRAARERGFSHIALTDTNNLYGLWPFLKACTREKLTPIVGAEVDEPDSDRRAVCLVQNEDGYRNLCRLLTRRSQDDDFDLLKSVAEKSRGLVVLTSDLDLLEGWHDAGVEVFAALPRRPSDAVGEIIKSAARLGRPAVAVPDSYFLEPGDFEVHCLLRAIDLNTSLSRLADSDPALPDAWLASAWEYEERFEMFPETITAGYSLAERLSFRGPDASTVMPPWEDAQGRCANEVLRQEAYAGARDVYGHDLSEAIVERLEHELAIIAAKDFSSYFLVVRDIIRRSPRICGRGSGAASLVAYCLRITNVCPLKNNLYFERFINTDRKDPPDIDVDFAWDERDDVLDSVLEQYEGRAAMVCNHVLFQPRMAIRETAKVFGLAEREISHVAKRLPWFWSHKEFSSDLEARLRVMPETRELEFPEPWPDILRLAQKIIGIPRHLSVHAGGMIITPRPLEEYTPIEKAPKGVPIVQWEKDGSEDAGLVKIDLLGNRSLGVIRDAIKSVRENGRVFDESKWEPEDDPPTRAAIARGLTMGCFYIESPAMRLFQQKAGVGDFQHLVIHSSIIRPAANEFVREYIRRLKGGDWQPIHPLLTDILDETFGIMVFQEDVSKTAVAMAGFSHAEADGLRKVMARKDKETALRDYKAKFEAGARAKGVSEESITAVWEMMLSFSGYSFCKPHSASYARVSFQAAYLKVHYPAEFMAAVISNQGGFYSAFAYVSEAWRLGLKVLPPDVNQSDISWKGANGSIRVGLQSIKGLGVKTRDRIVSEREIGLFSGFEDFLIRVRPDEDEARALVQAGAFDDVEDRQEHALLLWKLAGKRTARVAAGGRGASGSLFPTSPDLPPPNIPPGSEIERLRRQYAVLGFLPDRHPIVLFKGKLPKGLLKAKDLSPQMAGRRIRMAGWLITGKLVSTKTGQAMKFLTFEDETGIVETTFFPRAYKRFCNILDRGRPYILNGKVDVDFGIPTLIVDHIQPVGP